MLARPVTGLERGLRWGRHPAQTAAYGLEVLAVLLGSLAGGATWLWQRAEGALRGEQEARKGEAEAREGEKRALQELKLALYREQVRGGYQDWPDNHVTRTDQLLQRCPPEPRGWEWHYVLRPCHSELRVFKGHTGRVESVCFSPDGARLASASLDRTARVWDVETGREVLCLPGHTDGVRGVCFSPDGQRLATSCQDGTAKVWDARTGRAQLTLQGHAGRVRGICFSPDGQRLATSSSDSSVKLWDAHTGQELLSFQGHTSWATSVCFSPDSNYLASASGRGDGSVRIWDATPWTDRRGDRQ